MRAEASICSRVSDNVVMRVIFKGGIFEFMCRGCTRNGIFLRESWKKLFEFIAMYKTLIPCVNVMNNLQW